MAPGKPRRLTRFITEATRPRTHQNQRPAEEGVCRARARAREPNCRVCEPVVEGRSLWRQGSQGDTPVSSRKQLDREHTRTQRLRKRVFVEYEYENEHEHEYEYE